MYVQYIGSYLTRSERTMQAPLGDFVTRARQAASGTVARPLGRISGPGDGDVGRSGISPTAEISV